MPYEVMLQKAHNIIDEIPREKIEYVVVFLKDFEAKEISSNIPKEKNTILKLKKFCGKVDFDIET